MFLVNQEEPFNLFELLLAHLVLAFLGLQETVELFFLLALDVLLELFLIIGKVLGLKGEKCQQTTFNTMD